MEKIPNLSTAEQYNERYSNEEQVFSLGIPDAFTLKTSELLPQNATVLELGAGQGRTALALAQRGFSVKAVDISEVGVQCMNRAAKDLVLANFEAHVGDARDAIEGKFDFITSFLMLHHLTTEEALNSIKKSKEHTNEGGIHAIVAFTNESQFARLDDSHGMFYPTTDELRNLYSDWEILSYSERKSYSKFCNPDGSRLINMSAEIAARKPIAS